MLDPQRTGRRNPGQPPQQFELVVGNTDGTPGRRPADRWGSPFARFVVLLVASIVLWTAIGFGLWRLVRALW